MSFQNILVFRIGHLGDTILALPALWTVRENFGSARITLLTNMDTRNPGYVSPIDVLPRAGLIDGFIAYPTNLRRFRATAAFARLLKEIRLHRFDALIYLMPRMRSARQIERDVAFFRLCGIKRVLGAEYLRSHGLRAPIPVPTPSARSEADFMLDLLASERLTIAPEERRTDLLLTESEMKKARVWFENDAQDRHLGKRMIAIAPGSKWKSKIWFGERFLAVVNELVLRYNCYPIVFGGPEDKQLAARLVQAWGVGSSAAGVLSIRESAALIRLCELYLGNDTGTMHLAAAVGTPCVATFAALDWKGRWSPIGNDHIVFRKSVPCEGCLTPDCFNDHQCLDLIKTEEVLAACVRLLARRDVPTSIP